MADEKRSIEISVQSQKAEAALLRLADKLDRLESTTMMSDRQLDRLEKTLLDTTIEMKTAAGAIARLRAELKASDKNATSLRQTIKSLEDRLATSNKRWQEWKQKAQDARRENATLTSQLNRTTKSLDTAKATIQKLTLENRNLLSANKKVTAALANSAEAARKSSTAEDRLLNIRRNLAKQFNNAKPLQITQFGISQGGVVPLSQFTNGLKAVETQTRKTAKAGEELNEHFQSNALRYAAYDMANSFRILRDGALRALRDVLGTSIDFERQFANVVRTSQLNTETQTLAVQALRNAFLDLQSTLPVTTEELTRIGTLAAQMGISVDKIASFTEVTAKFSATSGIAADEAATSLARVGQMLKSDVQDDYERLASAILKTGVNAIATEQQIVRGTTQIASIGNVAGLSAQEIVALSSAMSSLGMSPELQRSVITSSFTRILTAVRGSTEQAEKFGAVLGMTGKEFQQAWEGDGYNTYRKLLAAIADSPNAIGILQDLRLSSQRLTPNLLKMGQAYGLLGETLADTKKGWEEDAELQRQYQVIMDTTAAKLQVLQQTWDAFLAVFGSGGAQLLGQVAESLEKTLKQMRGFAASPFGAAVGTMAIVVAALGVALLSVLTAVTLAGAGLLGFQYVQRELMVAASATNGVLLGQTAIVNTLSWSMKVATGSVKLLNLALKALAPIAAATLIVGGANSLGNSFRDIRNWTKGATDDIDVLVDKLTKAGDVDIFAGLKNAAAFKDLEGMIEQPVWVAELQRAIPGITNFVEVLDARGSNEVIGDLSKLDEEIAKLAGTNPQKAAAYMSRLRDSWQEAGLSSDVFNAYMTDTNSALSLQAEQLGITQDQLEDYYAGVEDAANAEERAALQTAALADALGLVGRTGKEAEDALSDFMSSFSGGMGGFFDISTMIEDAYGTGTGQGGGLARLQADLDENLKDAGNWADGIQQLFTKGASSLAQAFAAQGPASQQAVVDALKLGPEALSQLEQSMADAAFFASDAYAQAFAQETGTLAQVYKQMLSIDPEQALNAVHDVREAIRSGGALSPDELAGLQAKYGFKLNVDLVPQISEEDLDVAVATASAKITPITVPVETSIGQGDFTINEEVQNWIVEMEGHTIVLPVDPNTDEGRDKIALWRKSEYDNKVVLQSFLNLDPATAQLNTWFAVQKQRVLQINVRSNLPELDLGTGHRYGIATGGLINSRKAGDPVELRGYAGGGVLRGPGTGTSDSILARVSNGEFIMRAAAVRAYGTDFFDRLNRMQLPKFAGGGSVSTSGSGGGGTVVNATVHQYYPTTQDPIKKLKTDAESVLAGIWT